MKYFAIAAALLLGIVFTVHYNTSKKQASPSPSPVSTSAPLAAQTPNLASSSTAAPPKLPIAAKQAPGYPYPIVIPAPIVVPAPLPAPNVNQAPYVTPAPLRTTEPASPTEVPSAQQVSQFEQNVFQLVNQERAKAGLAALTMDNALFKVAKVKAQDMYNNHYFDHNSPTYGSPFDMMTKFGVSYRTAGENIANGHTSPEQVMNEWMNSQGHRANILNSSYTKIGISEYNKEWVQEFIG